MEFFDFLCTYVGFVQETIRRGHLFTTLYYVFILFIKPKLILTFSIYNVSFKRISRSSNKEYNQNVTRIFHLNSINMSGVGALHFMALDVPPWPEVSSNFDKRKHFCVHANFPTDNPRHSDNLYFQCIVFEILRRYCNFFLNNR